MSDSPPEAAEKLRGSAENLSVVGLYHSALERRGFKSDSSQLRAESLLNPRRSSAPW